MLHWFPGCNHRGRGNQMVPVKNPASWSSCLCCWHARISHLHLSDLRGCQEQHCGSLCKYNPFHMPVSLLLSLQNSLEDSVLCSLQVLLFPFWMSFILPLGILALSRCAWKKNGISTAYPCLLTVIRIRAGVLVHAWKPTVPRLWVVLSIPLSIPLLLLPNVLVQENCLLHSQWGYCSCCGTKL